MRIYVFKSVSTERLRAFASDPDVNNLPRQHGPWVITGAMHRAARRLITSRARPLKRRSPHRDFSFGVCVKVPKPRPDAAFPTDRFYGSMNWGLTPTGRSDSVHVWRGVTCV
jgi:hypothetical protein